MMMLAMILAAAALPSRMVEVRRFAAAEAHQGVVADTQAVYAIGNSVIGRYDTRTGQRVALWQGDAAQIPHLNSCIVRRVVLTCAGSNYPAVPMRSMIVTFDAATLVLKRRIDLPGEFGSLTWLDRRQGEWWAGFANYDGRGGTPGRGHEASVVVRYGGDFRVRAVYRFPQAVLDRFAPRSPSGGLWLDGTTLAVTGHDRPELYLLRVPKTGDRLELVGTVATPTEGQAIGRDGDRRGFLWSIDRGSSEAVLSRLER